MRNISHFSHCTATIKRGPTTLSIADEKRSLFLEPELLGQSAVYALVVGLEVLQVLAAVGDEAEESAAGALVLTVFIQMSRELFNATCQNSDLHLRRTGIGVMAGALVDFVLLLSLRKHKGMIAHSPLFCKRLRARRYSCGVVEAASTFTSLRSKIMVEFAGIMTFPSGSFTSWSP